eukprot:g35409.t1
MGYVIERQEQGTEEWVRCLTTEGSTTVEILGESVPNEARYRFRVCSINNYGRSEQVEFPGVVHLVILGVEQERTVNPEGKEGSNPDIVIKPADKCGAVVDCMLISASKRLSVGSQALLPISPDHKSTTRHQSVEFTTGVAMGTCMGPSYACLFIGYVEQSLFSTYTSTVPQLFRHYIDLCIGAASCAQAELDQFNHFRNNFHPVLKFT